MVQHQSTKKSSTRRWSASTLHCLLVSTTLFVLCLYLGLVLSFVRRHFLLHDETRWGAATMAAANAVSRGASTSTNGGRTKKVRERQGILPPPMPQ